MAISYVGAGAGTSGTVAVTPALPSGLATNDILILVVEQANQATTIANSGGGTWTQVSGSPQGTGTAASTTATGCQVYWSRYNGTQTAPQITDAGDHTGARIYAYRGVSTSNAINASTGSVEATSDTSLSATGPTTSATDCWVLIAATLMDDAQDFGATWTNANLTGITVRNASFGHASGNDGRLVLVDGVKATASAVGNTTNTLTVASVKAMIVLALEPGIIAGAATITPAVLRLDPVAVTATPGQVTTTITPATLRLEAVAVGGAPGPGTLILTPAVLRLDPVPVTAAPQPVTTTITPAVLRLEPGKAIVPLFESFNKADGTPLGPDRTWARHVYVESDQWQTVSARARYAVNAATDLVTHDLQFPTPNIAGIPNQQATVTITDVDHTGDPNYGVSVGALVRFALYNGDADFRGYLISIALTDALDPGVPTIWLYLGRYDSTTELTTLSVSAAVAPVIGLPGTLTVRADSNQISGEFTHGGSGATLAVAATDTTYNTGDVALLGRADLNAGDTALIEIDNLYAYVAPAEPATIILPPAVLRLAAAAMIFLDIIDALDSATPPTDIYDAGDTATPPTDLNDPEVGLVDLTPVTVRLDPVQVSPLGEGPSQTPITPVLIRLDAVPVTATPGQVTTSITPAVLRLSARPVQLPFVAPAVNLNITVGSTRSRAQTETSATRNRAAVTPGVTRSRALIADIDDTRVGTLVGATRDG